MKYLIPLLVIIIAAGTAIGLYSTSTKSKKAAPKRPVPLVETAEIRPAREKVAVEAFGTVIPAKRITLQSEVDGRIIDQHPELVPGGLISQGDIVVQIDPAGYQLRVSEYRAELEEAKFELDLEQGKQVIAGREWQLMEKEISAPAEGRSLALREPHLRLVKAKVDKAQSRLSAAELDLERTTVRAPFNALVLEEFIDRGQLVNSQSPIAILAGSDEFWVSVSVPVSVLDRITLPSGQGSPGAAVQVMFEPVSGSPLIRFGHVLRILGDLDPEGRMARLIVGIDDPFNLNPGMNGQAANSRVLLGSYVKVLIDAGSVDNVYAIPREALREGDAVWIKDGEDKLQIRNVSVVWRRKDDVLVNADLKQGDRLILSRLQSPLPGMTIKSMNK